MSKSTDAIFICHDLDTAAYLWARGIRFLGVQAAPTATNPRHVAFRFSNFNRVCEDEIAKYVGGAHISAREFALSLRQLKDQLVTFLKSVI
jgi:hypothetical protein